MPRPTPRHARRRLDIRRLSALLPSGWLRAQRRRDERGDIPGWVMITVLTIGLAITIFTLFGDAVTNYLNQALNQLQ